MISGMCAFQQDMEVRYQSVNPTMRILQKPHSAALTQKHPTPVPPGKGQNFEYYVFKLLFITNVPNPEADHGEFINSAQSQP